ncbi:MAG TPA: DUF885 domain-containing protein [Steroidobacter sp.]|uniref:DUF885 domain-containing protein n=1 Tax=Steroidobacter sp. TaxID=1978227 RepID=UPI002EDB11E8
MNKIVAVAAMWLTLAVSGVASAAPTETQRLNAFFERVFERSLMRSPLRQTRLGLKTQQDRWDDISERRQLEDVELVRGDLEGLRRFDFAKLDSTAQLSYRLFERNSREALRAYEWRHSGYLITQMGGLHRRVATTLLNEHSIAERADAEAYIARLRGVRPLMMELVSQLQTQASKGVQPPRFVYDLTLSEAENLLKGRPFEDVASDGPVLADFRAKLAQAKFPGADAQGLLKQAEAALLEGFGPGYRALIAELRRAQTSATDADGVWKLPKGADYYRFCIESYTTLPLTPAEIHALGLKEVARIHDDMRAIMKQVGFTGSLQAFFTHMREDLRYYYADSAEGRAQYLKDADALLQVVKGRQLHVVSRVPKADVVVKPVPAWREKSSAKAYYHNPSEDGVRPGVFYINLYDMKAQPRYLLPVVLYHEAIPGHHLEVAISYELAGLPRFRKLNSVASYSEGWGLYTERLAAEMGLYQDPYQQFGRLTMELMRAARLVVDTGLHDQRWSREQAVAYLDANMPGSHYDNQREIDRYIVLPGQATSYSVGMLKIIELRERAQRALGKRFQLTRFHDIVLGSGPLPLPMLEENVDAWIKAERGRE